MKSNSIFAATFIKGEANNESEQWIYHHCGKYTLEHRISIVEKEGLCGKQLRWIHPNKQTWIVICKKENKDAIPDL